jgi:hypothetical protein
LVKDETKEGQEAKETKEVDNAKEAKEANNSMCKQVVQCKSRCAYYIPNLSEQLPLQMIATIQ